MQAITTGWGFFQNEILGMQWLNRLIGGAVEACGLDPAGRVGGSVQFFFYDTIKIMVLLGVLILVISYIQSYFPPERTKKILAAFTVCPPTALRRCWAPSRRSAPARPFHCLSDLPVPDCRWV